MWLAPAVTPETHQYHVQLPPGLEEGIPGRASPGFPAISAASAMCRHWASAYPGHRVPGPPHSAPRTAPGARLCCAVADRAAVNHSGTYVVSPPHEEARWPEQSGPGC